ncbi:glycosyltransferase family 2 protein [Ekhidna sp.]
MTNSNPLVSVVLPFYNAPYLKEAIDSILNQTYSNFELILVDNGSTDNSVQVAKRYKRHPLVTIINEPNRGVVHAANRGIEAAKGEFIARMDADDIAKPFRLQVQVNEFLKDPDLQVVSGLVDYLGPKENEGFIQYVNWLNTIKSERDISLNQFVEFPIANPTLMIRSEVFAKHGMYELGDFPEDYEFFLRLQAEGVKMGKVDEHILFWRDTESRLTRKDEHYSQDAFFRIKAKYLAKWLALNNPNHPKVYLWGAGRLSRRRSDYLIKEGVQVVSYVDLKEAKNTIHYSKIPGSEEAFVVSYVGNRGARDNIRSYLNQNGYSEGVNYIMAS